MAIKVKCISENVPTLFKEINTGLSTGIFILEVRLCLLCTGRFVAVKSSKSYSKIQFETFTS